MNWINNDNNCHFFFNFKTKSRYLKLYRRVFLLRQEISMKLVKNKKINKYIENTKDVVRRNLPLG